MSRDTVAAPEAEEAGAGTDAVAHAAAVAVEVDAAGGLLVGVLAGHYAAHWNPGTDLK